MRDTVVLEPVQKPSITHTQIVRYAGAAGDFHPLHTVVPFAEQTIFKGVIAHGMMIKGYIGQAIGHWFDVENLIYFKTRFQAITRPGEKITIFGKIEEETLELWNCSAQAVNEEGEVKASAEFNIKKC